MHNTNFLIPLLSDMDGSNLSHWFKGLELDEQCITLSDAIDTFYLFYQFHKSSYDLEINNFKRGQSMKEENDLRALIMLISLMVAVFFTQTSKVSTIKHNVSNPYAGFVIK